VHPELTPVPPAVVPSTGSPLGGDTVTITGLIVNDQTTVTFNGVPALSLAVLSARELRVVTPPGEGNVPVTVTTPIDAGPVAVSLNFGYTELTVSVVRPDDLLALRFELVNLHLDGGDLVRRDPAADAIVVVNFPPQHIAEPAFAVLAGPPPGPPVAAVMAGESRLAFRCPRRRTACRLRWLPCSIGRCWSP
jgi:IPT/TIG domain-containing protein